MIEALRSHLDALTAFGPRHRTRPRAVGAALRYITDQLTASGHDVHTERYGSEPHEVNLVAVIAGTEPDRPLLEIGAHWDSVETTPGADDNASGVAALLEAARILRAGPPPRQGVCLAFYGEEEYGFIGSREHLAAAGPHEGAIILEMIGYTRHEEGSQRFPEGFEAFAETVTRGDFVAVVGDLRAAGYVEALRVAAPAGLPAIALAVPDDMLDPLRRSDQVPFWDAGLPGVMITDTSDYRTPHYHRPSDTVDTLDLPFMAHITTMVAEGARALTSRP